MIELWSSLLLLETFWVWLFRRFCPTLKAFCCIFFYPQVYCEKRDPVGLFLGKLTFATQNLDSNKHAYKLTKNLVTLDHMHSKEF